MKTRLSLLTAAVLIFVMMFTLASCEEAEEILNALDSLTEATSYIQTEKVKESTQNTSQTETQKYTDASQLYFRNEELLEKHYKKHGIEMGFSDMYEYEQAAANVVVDPSALHKTEKEDGDDVYYIESTNEFVIVSSDGYIRTYFNPDSGINYYNKQ